MGQKHAEIAAERNGNRKRFPEAENQESPHEAGRQRQDLPDQNTGFLGSVKTVLTTTELVEAALAEALTKATIAGAWDAVKAITGELGARRRERS